MSTDHPDGNVKLTKWAPVDKETCDPLEAPATEELLEEDVVVEELELVDDSTVELVDELLLPEPVRADEPPQDESMTSTARTAGTDAAALPMFRSDPLRMVSFRLPEIAQLYRAEVSSKAAATR